MPPATGGRAGAYPFAEGRVFDESPGEFGVEIARGEGIHLDATRSKIGAHALREHRHSSFGRRIGCDAWPTELRLHRPNIDDFSSPTRHHPASDGLANEKYTGQVGRDQVVPIRQGELDERVATLDSCIVHQNVEGADLGLDTGNANSHLRRIRHIKYSREHCGAGCAGQFSSSGFENDGVAAVQHDARTRLRETRCKGKADASAGSGDESDSIAEVEQ